MKRKWLEKFLKGTTHQKVANEANIDRSYFTQIVNGQRSPSPNVARRIAKVLGFSDEWYRLLEKDSVIIEKEIIKQ